MRLTLTLALLGIVHCTCRTGVGSANGDLTVRPAALHFADTFVGGSVTLGVEIQNDGLAVQNATLRLPAPFVVAHDGLQIPGGSSVEVDVTFTPTFRARSRACSSSRPTIRCSR